MAKKVKALVKLQIPAGNANPAPPVGPALGQHGANIMEFCKAFNEKTKQQEPGILFIWTGVLLSSRKFLLLQHF